MDVWGSNMWRQVKVVYTVSLTKEAAFFQLGNGLTATKDPFSHKKKRSGSERAEKLLRVFI